jgi:membrane carboxypeptidase/penicillin-binding protein
MLKGGALLLFAALAAMVIQFGWAYLRTPQLVSQFERSTPPPLDPIQLGEVRLEWLLTVDDPTFYSHYGVDGRTRGAGYTTITQGIVKFLFFDQFEPGLLRWRKVKQTIIAVAFNARVSKQEQLRLFVNAVYLGTRDDHDVRGFPEASKAYYGRPFMGLSDEEYLGLVAMIVAPAKYSLATHPDQNHERVQRIRRLLARECEPRGIGDVEYSSCAK